MEENGVLKKLIKSQTKQKYSLEFDGKIYPLEDVIITKSATPVRKPTTRGGIYFSGTVAHKIKGVTSDLSLVPLFSKVMLGPSTEFQELKIKTELEIDGKIKPVILITHLTNTMQSSSKVELNMVIIKTVVN